jgi:hypothetical protein
MSLDSNYNRQFIQIDFRLLEDPAFLRFVGRAEFATYLILRRYVWRGGEHRLGLHELYAKQRKLASSVGVNRISEMLGLIDTTQVSRHLTSLCELGVVERIRTGRENIYILGQWHRPRGWTVSKEFYYLEERFGASPGKPGPKANGSDLDKTSRSDLQRKPDQSWRQSPGQTKRKAPDSNRESNREINTVRNGIQKLPDQNLAAGERDYLAQEILDELGDEHSRRFYQLVAAKVPEQVIRKALGDIKADGADDPAKVFTYRMNQYALKKLRSRIGDWDRAA